jgi:thymidylate synthase
MKTGDNIDVIYCNLLRKILAEGRVKQNRTGIATTSLSGFMLEYDMTNGFPLLTTKKMAWKTLRVELEGFIKGVTDKTWFQERGAKIWTSWCNPTKVPYGHDAATQEAMAAEKDLGPIYGYQWRNFNGNYLGPNTRADAATQDAVGVDQLEWAIRQLKTNPDSRRIIVSAWNPQQLNEMALVPCHYAFQLLANDGKLDLLWNQR